MLGDHDEMPNPGDNVAGATRAGVNLASLIGLDDVYDERSESRVHQPNTAQRTTTKVITMNVMTMARSAVVLSC